jgi:hypothetical protein
MPTKTGNNPRVLTAKRAAVCLTVFLIAVSTGVAQDKKKESTTRSVSGTVTTPDGKPAVGAVVQLKDTKTKNVRSFYTQDKGDYYFHELSTDIAYELSATYRDQGTILSSGTKTLSVFDSRKDALVNLKLNAKN